MDWKDQAKALKMNYSLKVLDEIVSYSKNGKTKRALVSKKLQILLLIDIFSY